MCKFSNKSKDINFHLETYAYFSFCIFQNNIHENRMLITQNNSLDTKLITELKKGAGVTLQKYKEGKLTDALPLNDSEGFSWSQGESRTRSEPEITEWLGNRAAVGKMPPRGFPKDGKFDS